MLDAILLIFIGIITCLSFLKIASLNNNTNDPSAAVITVTVIQGVFVPIVGLWGLWGLIATLLRIGFLATWPVWVITSFAGSLAQVSMGLLWLISLILMFSNGINRENRHFILFSKLHGISGVFAITTGIFSFFYTLILRNIINM